MKDILRIFEFEFLKQVKTKSFVITTIVLAAVVIGLTTFMRFMIGSEIEESAEKPTTVGVIAGEIPEDELKDIFEDYRLFGSEDEVYQAIEDEEIEYGIEFKELDDVTILVKRAGTGSISGEYVRPIKDYIMDQKLGEHGLSQAKIDTMYDEIEIKEDIKALKEVNVMAFVGGFVSIILIYIMVLGSGQAVASAIAMEKQDRTMEILLSSTSPSALIHGKVLASLASALLQLLVIGIASAVGVLVNIKGFISQMPELVGEGAAMAEQANSFEAVSQIMSNLNIQLDSRILIISILFFITGYFLYVYIFAALGASVSKIEDLGIAIMPITMITVFIYIGAILALQNPDGKLMEVLSFIPFSSVFIAVIRYVLSDMSIAMLGLSYLILLLTTIIFVRLSVKLYRMTSLNYGNTSFKSQIKALFTKE